MASRTRAEILSIIPDNTGKITWDFYSFQGTTGLTEMQAFLVEGSLSADATLQVFARVPNPLPAGALNLTILAAANATTGQLTVDPRWFALATGADPSTVTLQSEGNTNIIWGAGDADDIKATSIVLDDATAAAGLAADGLIVLHVDLKNPESTLATAAAIIPIIEWIEA